MKKLSILFLLCILLLTGCGSPTDDTPPIPEEQLPADLAADLPHDERYDVIPTLLGTAVYEGRTFALVSIKNDTYTEYLVEYRQTAAGDYELLAAVSGWHNFTYGLHPCYTQFGDLTVAWSYIFDDRLATTADEQNFLEARVPTDYTHIRFYWTDGSTQDAPMPDDPQNRLFFRVIDGNTLPEYAVPLYKNVEISAAKMPTEYEYGNQIYEVRYYNDSLATYYSQLK